MFDLTIRQERLSNSQKGSESVCTGRQGDYLLNSPPWCTLIVRWFEVNQPSASGTQLRCSKVMRCKWLFKRHTDVPTAVPRLAFSSSSPAPQFEDTGPLQGGSLQRI
ncbi:hypothetical protein EYF80_003770 [Liparis tanakae]|uniref:Uncharacterized protein n=1 Tax=Liparis tanakae TaxID=230148 RepID=A0A4Z2J6V8_9TELE|nr:hypothetical protein EYF80_003770 [Liparis tanakae]